MELEGMLKAQRNHRELNGARRDANGDGDPDRHGLQDVLCEQLDEDVCVAGLVEATVTDQPLAAEGRELADEVGVGPDVCFIPVEATLARRGVPQTEGIAPG